MCVVILMIVNVDFHLYCIGCVDGSFGLECSGVCHCLHDAACVKSNGKCPQSKCAAGWQDMDCQAGLFLLKILLFYTEM